MPRRFLPVAAIAAAFFVVGYAHAQAPEPASSGFPVPGIYLSTGPTGQVLRIGFDAEGAPTTTVIYAAGGGFKPEEVAYGPDGLYVCDQSNSEIFRVGLSGSIETLYERDTAISPFDPEQPIGCALRQRPGGVTDLLFISRRGRGGSQKTGIWRLPDVVGTPGPIVPQLPFPLDDPNSANGLAVAANGDVYFSSENQVWVIDDFDAVEPAATPFTQTTGEAFAVAVNDSGGVLEVYAASQLQGLVEGFDASGTLCSAITYPSGDRPVSMEFSIAGDLWSVTAQRSNGRDAKLFRVETPACGGGNVGLTESDTLASLEAVGGLALGPSVVTATLDIQAAGKTANADLCTTLFNLEPQVFNGPACTANLECRLFEVDEFRARTLATPFLNTQCVQLYGLPTTVCAEMRISIVDSDQEPSPQCIQDVISNWFLLLEPGTPVFRPGILFSHGAPNADGTYNDLTEDIFRELNLLVDPSNPDDPRYTGSRDEFASGIVAVNGVDNKAPTADAGPDQTVPICTVPTYLSLSGSATDPDQGVMWRDALGNILPMEGDFLFEWTGEGISGTAVGATQSVDVSGLTDGTYTYTLQVTDNPLDTAVSGATPLSDTDTADVTIVRPLPVIGEVEVAPSALWPPNHEMETVGIRVIEFADGCGTAADPATSCRVKNITSSDPINGTGDGDQEPDWSINGVGGATSTSFGVDLATVQFQFRAERSEAGEGRTYTITIECRDALGHLTTKDVSVRVTDNQGGD